MSDIIPLTEKQKFALQDVVDGKGYFGAPVLVGGDDPHRRVIVLNFDGTNNDRDAVPDGELQSLVATFDRSLKNSEVLQTRYYEGVGTRTWLLPSLVEGATGSGSLERAERAYNDVVAQTDSWRSIDPDVKVHIHVTSFSRGGGSALHVLNMIDKEGIKPLAGGSFEGAPVPAALRPGQVTSSATLIDTVVTGQHDKLDLGLPNSTLSVLQVKSELEFRRAFSYSNSHDPGRGKDLINSREVAFNPETRPRVAKDANGVYTVAQADEQGPHRHTLYARVTTLNIPGAHSDIGGTYGSGGIREVSQFAVDRHHQRLGFDVTPHAPTPEHIQAAFAHDSRWTLDKLVDVLAGDHERGQFNKPISGWDGSVEFNVLKGKGDMLYTYVAPRDICEPGDNFTIPTDKLGRNHVGLVVLDPNGNVALSLHSDKAYEYDAQIDRLTLYGRPLNFLGGKEAITKAIASSGYIELAISPEKILRMSRHNDYSAVHLPAEPATALPMREPAAALDEILTRGLRLQEQPALQLTREERESIVRELAVAHSDEKLVLRKNGEISFYSDQEFQQHPAKPGDVVFLVESLRDAIGVEPAAPNRETSQVAKVEAAPAAMEM